jgi:hypothetical protein
MENKLKSSLQKTKPKRMNDEKQSKKCWKQGKRSIA